MMLDLKVEQYHQQKLAKAGIAGGLKRWHAALQFGTACNCVKDSIGFKNADMGRQTTSTTFRVVCQLSWGCEVHQDLSARPFILLHRLEFLKGKFDCSSRRVSRYTLKLRQHLIGATQIPHLLMDDI